jgi:hypothetical protein
LKSLRLYSTEPFRHYTKWSERAGSGTSKNRTSRCLVSPLSMTLHRALDAWSKTKTNPDYLGSPSFPDLGGIGKAASVAIDLKISLRPTIFALATSQQQGSQLRLEKHCEQHVETQHCECSPMAVQWPVAIPEFCCSHNDVPSNYLYPSEALGGVDEFWGQLPFCTADYI